MLFRGIMGIVGVTRHKQIYSVSRTVTFLVTKGLLGTETTASESDRLPEKLLSYSYGRLLPNFIDIGSDLSAAISGGKKKFITLYTVKLTPAFILFLWRGKKQHPPSGAGPPHSRSF